MVVERRLLGARRVVLLLIVLAGLWSAWHLRLNPVDLVTAEGGWRAVGNFFAAALSPALTYEDTQYLPDDAPPLLLSATGAAITTVVLAAAALSVAVALAIPLSFLASSAWWTGDPTGGESRVGRWLRRSIGPVIFFAMRLLIGAMRSVHELLWALIFFVILGMTPLAAVIAIVIPYAGTLAKIYSEMIDETPRDAANALRMTGASPARVFFVGLFPRALPDICAYTLYRFECALRSSAVMGFFGIATIGKFIRLADENLHYHEVWTYLYVLVALVVAVDLWSSAVRRRLMA